MTNQDLFQTNTCTRGTTELVPEPLVTNYLHARKRVKAAEATLLKGIVLSVYGAADPRGFFLSVWPPKLVGTSERTIVCVCVCVLQAKRCGQQERIKVLSEVGSHTFILR